MDYVLINSKIHYYQLWVCLEISFMIPLLICAYWPRYLDSVIEWLKAENVEEKFRIIVWDNGGAKDICTKHHVRWCAINDKTTFQPVNLGKALAMRYLVDVVMQELPNADCYVCMDDDVIVDRNHLETLVEAALRPSLGMIGPRYHPFNSPAPPGGSIVELDSCPECNGDTADQTACKHCGGSGKDPHGLRLRTYPTEDRTVNKFGRIAGTLFAISKEVVEKLKWAPHLYPLRLRESDNKPIVYWTEDAELDKALTELGFTNGYLEMTSLTPVIHLPELNPEYMKWKLKARTEPPMTEFDFGNDGDR